MESTANQDKNLSKLLMSSRDETAECCTTMDAEPLAVENNEAAVTSDIPESGACVGNENVEPYVGMEFESIQVAADFYNDYARYMGFSIRSSTTYHSKKDKTLVSKVFVCSKEGFRESSFRESKDSKVNHLYLATREGCKAKIIVRKRVHGKWYIARFEKNHNHTLVSSDKVHLLRSHRRIPNAKEKLTGLDNDEQVNGSPRSFEDETIECCSTMDSEPVMVENVETRVISDIPESIACVRDRNVEPHVGLEFESLQAAGYFYNAYARHAGFSIRSSTTYHSKKDKTLISKVFVCSKQGFRENKVTSDGRVRRSRPATREGCNAKIIVRKRDNGKWYIGRFEKNHTHALVSPNEVLFLRSHRRMPKVNSKLVDHRKNAELRGIVDVFRNEPGRISNNGFTEKDCRSYVGKGQSNTKGLDAQIISEYFKRMQAKDPSFFYTIQADQFQTLKNVFWVDSRSRVAYRYFGDVVRLDMTYKADQFEVPFTPFMGVNHHRQLVSFGSALLTDENESTFVWLFDSWLKAMSNKHPVTIVTDQEDDMTAAIAKVFPKTRHTFCKWQILRKVPKKLDFIVQKDPYFDWELEKCINKSDTICEFESTWGSLLEKYNLKDNEWLQSIYNVRRQWVPAYLRDMFFAGMCTTQKSESINTFFDGYINAKMNLQEFVVQCEKALDDIYEKEHQADASMLNDKPTLKTLLPMEQEAAKIYTREIFAIFQEEINASIVCAVHNHGENRATETCLVAKIDEQNSYTVVFNRSETKAACECKKFEFEGILCRHILAMFKVKNIFTFPSHYILKRWTKNAKKGIELDLWGVEMQDNCQDSPISRYNNLCQLAIEIAEAGMTSLDVYKVALSSLQEAKKKIYAAKEVTMVTQFDTPVVENNHEGIINKGSQVDSLENQISIQDHSRVTTEGCTPTHTGYKNPREDPTKRKACSMCKVEGHTKSTCKMSKGLEPNVDTRQSDRCVPFVVSQCGFEENTVMPDREISFLGSQCRSQGNNIMTGQSDQGLPFITLLQKRSDREISFTGSQCGTEVNNNFMGGLDCGTSFIASHSRSRDLKGYIDATREKLHASGYIENNYANQDYQSFIEKLNEVEEWLCTDGGDAPASEFEERLNLLRSIGNPILFRLNELGSRPAAPEHVQRYVGELQQGEWRFGDL